MHSIHFAHNSISLLPCTLWLCFLIHVLHNAPPVPMHRRFCIFFAPTGHAITKMHGARYTPVPCGFHRYANLLHTVALHKGWEDAPPTTCFVFSEALHLHTIWVAPHSASLTWYTPYRLEASPIHFVHRRCKGSETCGVVHLRCMWRCTFASLLHLHTISFLYTPWRCTHLRCKGVSGVSCIVHQVYRASCIRCKG